MSEELQTEEGGSEDFGALADFEAGDETGAGVGGNVPDTPAGVGNEEGESKGEATIESDHDITGEPGEGTVEPEVKKIAEPEASPKAEPEEKEVGESSEAEPIAATTESITEPAKLEPIIEASLTPEQKETQMQEIRDDLLTQLTTRYTMTDAEEEEFTTNPKTFIAQSMARVQLEAFEAAYQAIVSQLPTVIANTTQASSASAKAEETFYSAYPALKDHAERVMPIAQWVSQNHPEASQEQRIKLTGDMSMAAFGLVAPATPASTPEAKPASGKREISRKPVPVPGTGAAGGAKEKPNEWEELADFEQKDT